MKKKLSIFLAFILFIICLVTTSSTNVVHADTTQATSNTYAIDIRYHDVMVTQDAYLPEKAVIGIGLKKPVDMYIDELDNYYICDSGNKAIYQYDPITKTLLNSLTYRDFKTPKGISIITDNDGNKLLYVADSAAERVFVFKYNTDHFEYYKEFGKPNSMLFGENDFAPSKIAVDRAGNMYIIGEGVLEGIIQLANTGEFLGYFSSNKVNKSLKEKMQDFIYDEKVLDMIGSSQPPTFTNVFTDRRGLVYSTTAYSASANYNRVKKHNTSGASIIDPIDAGNSPTDIYVGNNDMIYVSWGNGYISSYTEDGELLFIFGGQSNDNVAGLFKSLVSIAVDSNNNIWCLDGEKVAIHQFKPTDYTKLIYEAHDLYYNRDYQASIAKWNEVLSLNQVSAIAHNQIGLNYLYSQNYKQAMKHLKLAGDRVNYSQAFWEERNIWLQNNLGLIVFILVLLVAAVVVTKMIMLKNGINKETSLMSRFGQLKLVKDMKFNMTVLKSPYDNFYYVRTNKKGSTLSCIITMFVVFGIFLWYTLGKGFIFQYVKAGDVDIVALLVGYFGFIFLVVFCNWLVSSIQDGEGTFLAIFRTVIISLIPVAIAMVVVCLLSYVATTNEVFLLNLILYLGGALSIITLFLGIQNIHFYSFKKTIISFLLTLLLIAIIILVVLLLIILSTKLIQFIEVLLKEVFR